MQPGNSDVEVVLDGDVLKADVLVQPGNSDVKVVLNGDVLKADVLVLPGNLKVLPVECHDLPCGIPRKNEFWSSCRWGNRDVCPSGVRRLGKWDIIGFRVERHELPSELARKSGSPRWWRKEEEISFAELRSHNKPHKLTKR